MTPTSLGKVAPGKRGRPWCDTKRGSHATPGGRRSNRTGCATCPWSPDRRGRNNRHEGDLDGRGSAIQHLFWRASQMKTLMRKGPRSSKWASNGEPEWRRGRARRSKIWPNIPQKRSSTTEAHQGWPREVYRNRRQRSTYWTIAAGPRAPNCKRAVFFHLQSGMSANTNIAVRKEGSADGSDALNLQILPLGLGIYLYQWNGCACLQENVPISCMFHIIFLVL